MYLCTYTQQQKFMKQFSPCVRCSVISSFPSFRNLDGNQWNNFIVWCADCKRSLAEVLTLGTTDIWSQIVLVVGVLACVLKDVEQPPSFYPLGARGNPFSTVMTQTLDVSRSTHGAGGTKITPVWEPLIWMIQRLMLHINKGALRLYVSRVPLPLPSLTFEKYV